MEKEGFCLCERERERGKESNRNENRLRACPKKRLGLCRRRVFSCAERRVKSVC